MRTPLLSALVLLAMVLLRGGGPLSAADTSPPFEGTSLPQPPRQGQPWTAPKTKLPPTFVTATMALFRSGLADPRGGAYRAIEVGTGSCWGGNGIVTTHGWVLPARPGEKWRFAVCWNGLVYPIVSVGAPADLKADIMALVKEDEAMRAREARERPDWPFSRLRHAWSEAESVSHQTLLPLKAALLLRLGEEELARKLWETWAAGLRPNMNNNDRDLNDPFLLLATDWVWAEFDRAVCAHMRGDDRLALLSARSATAWREAVEQLAEERGFPLPHAERKGQKGPYLTFLDELPALLADQERRAKEKSKPPPAGRERANRIEARIRELEEVNARQWGQPGGVQLNWDARVAALILEGEAAVEPLLNCVETDTRLTRSVQFGRDFFHHRTILPVAEAAFDAVTEILDNSTFGHHSFMSDPERRKKAVGELRAYWEKFKSMPPEERWFRTLADDEAGAEQWVQAARNMVRGVKARRSLLYVSDDHFVEANPNDARDPKKQRAALRAKKGPSVTELLRRRVRELGSRENHGSLMENLTHADELAAVLADWDGAGSLEDLAWFTDTMRRRMSPDKRTNQSHFLASLSGWYRRRHDLGDRTALNEYAAWMREVRPEACRDNMSEVLRPLWEYPDHPAITRAADKLFGKGSPWVPVLQPALSYHNQELLTSPLLRLPAFREALLDSLADRSPGGTALRGEDQHVSLDIALGWGSSTTCLANDPLAPRPGTKVHFRICDLYAWRLAFIPGMPNCELYWPEAKRDKAVAACVGRLRLYGERFQPSPGSSSFDPFVARLAFPPLGHPATKEDVEGGRAIFSLSGEGPTRLVALPKYPLAALRPTLKAYPYESHYWDEKAHREGYELRYDQDGQVWQAEEVLRDGKWRRFYGFISRPSLDRVPAEEVEFPGGDGWTALSHGLECRLTLRPAQGPRAVGSPLVVAVELRNRRGVDVSVPARWHRPDGFALRPGVRVRLLRATGERDKTTQEPIWKELPARNIETLQADGPSRTLAPAEAFTAFEVDVNGLFAIARPGTYRLGVVFTSKDGGAADGEAVGGPFAVVPAPRPAPGK